jgi:uncharacterized membrane protein YhaH (DUF805 family)
LRLSPLGWALRPLKNYANFSGRASRAEFWWFFLFVILFFVLLYVVLFAGVFAAAASGASGGSAGMLGLFGILALLLPLCWLALLVPMIAVQVRRLHDIGGSGWWLGAFYLLYAVYVVVLLRSMRSIMASGAQPNPALFTDSSFGLTMILGGVMGIYMLVLLICYCLPGTKGPNQFGDDPYGRGVEEVFA